MTATLFFLSLIAPASPAPALTASAPPAWAEVRQDEEAVTDERPEVAQLVEKLAGHVKERGEQDEQAIAAVDELYREFAKSGPKDRGAIVKALEGCFKVKRTEELEPDVPDDRLYMACAVAMRDMGPESVKPLTALIGDKTHRKNLRLQRQIVLSLGKTKDSPSVKVLLDLLNHPQPEMQAAGAEALGEYYEADQKTRKKIVEDIIKVMMDQKTKVDTAPEDTEAAERWNTISGPMIATLQKVAAHDERVPQEWLNWWNDNKKADWGETGG